MLRIVFIVLAFYTTALSCIPCDDKVLEVTNAAANVIVKAGSEQQKTADIDLCSPFCSCTCCTGITFSQQTITVPVKELFTVFEGVTFAYLGLSPDGDLTSIWQPPRA